MKRLLFGCFLLFNSCDPDIPGEGITLPSLNLGIKLQPDTSYIKIGDTVEIYSKISNRLSDGTIIKDGKGIVGVVFSRSNETLITSLSFKSAKVGVDFEYEIIEGNVELNSSGSLHELIAIPIDDSISFKIKVIPLKSGIYGLYISSKFFEGSQGKTRTQPYFDMPNHHFDELWKIPGDNYKAGDYTYDTNYLFAVYE